MLLMVALQVYVSGAVESWTVAGAFGQRRFVAVTIFLVVGLAAFRRAAAACRVRSESPQTSPIVAVRLVELRVDGRIRHVNDGSAEARAAPQRVRRLRDPAAHGVRNCCIGTSRTDRRSTNRRGCALQKAQTDPTVRITYFADVRFPLERANGIQTMETCYALAARGTPST